MFDSFKNKYSLTFAQLGQKLGASQRDQEADAAKLSEGAQSAKARSR
jgi:hypothetical protein